MRREAAATWVRRTNSATCTKYSQFGFGQPHSTPRPTPGRPSRKRRHLEWEEYASIPHQLSQAAEQREEAQRVLAAIAEQVRPKLLLGFVP